MNHAPDCRCDSCVVEKADRLLAAAIVARLVLACCIEESVYVEQRALKEVCRAMLEYEDRSNARVQEIIHTLRAGRPSDVEERLTALQARVGAVELIINKALLKQWGTAGEKEK